MQDKKQQKQEARAAALRDNLQKRKAFQKGQKTEKKDEQSKDSK